MVAGNCGYRAASTHPRCTQPPAVSARGEWCFFTLKRSTLRPARWFAAVWSGVLLCTPRSANTAVRWAPFDACLPTCLPPSLPPSLSVCLCWELQSSGGVTRRRRKAFLIEVNASVPPSTCQRSHYHCKPVEQPPFGERPPTLYPRPSRGTWAGIWWTPVNLEGAAQQRPWLALILKTGI